jgi:hypothetical protein
MLTLRYMPDIDDIVQLAALSPTRRSLRRRAVRNTAVSMVLVCCVLALDLAKPMSGALPVTLICILAAGTYLRRALALSSRRPLRRWAHEVRHRSPELRQAHEADLTPEALTVRTDGTTQTYAWSRFAAFEESERQFVLTDRAGEPSVILPKRGLPDPSLIPVCRGLLTEYLAAVRRPGRDEQPLYPSGA